MMIIPRPSAGTPADGEAIGADEVYGPTILDGIPAFSGLDAIGGTSRDRHGIFFYGQYRGTRTPISLVDSSKIGQ